MDYVLLISIILEGIIAGLFFKSAVRGRPYLYGLTLTFIIYVIYDLARLFNWNINSGLLNGLFLIATLGALYSAWHLWKRVEG